MKNKILEEIQLNVIATSLIFGLIIITIIGFIFMPVLGIIVLVLLLITLSIISYGFYKVYKGEVVLTEETKILEDGKISLSKEDYNKLKKTGLLYIEGLEQPLYYENFKEIINDSRNKKWN